MNRIAQITLIWVFFPLHILTEQVPLGTDSRGTQP